MYFTPPSPNSPSSPIYSAQSSTINAQSAVFVTSIVSCASLMFGAIVTSTGYTNDETSLKIIGISLLILGAGAFCVVGACIANSCWNKRNVNSKSIPADAILLTAKLQSSKKYESV